MTIFWESRNQSLKAQFFVQIKYLQHNAINLRIFCLSIVPGRHSRGGGNPVILASSRFLDSRFHGNDI